MQVLKFIDWDAIVAMGFDEVANTVRVTGDKYANARPGPCILESTFEHEGKVRQFRAQVDGVLHVPAFMDLPEHVVETNFAECEDISALADEMVSAYGDEFDPTVPCTVLWFRKVD
jgi:hypothetical protein